MKLKQLLDELEYPKQMHGERIAVRDEKGNWLKWDWKELPVRFFTGNMSQDKVLTNNLHEDVMYANIEHGEGVFATTTRTGVAYWMIFRQVIMQWDNNTARRYAKITTNIKRLNDDEFDCADAGLKNKPNITIKSEHESFAAYSLTRALKR